MKYHTHLISQYLQFNRIDISFKNLNKKSNLKYIIIWSYIKNLKSKESKYKVLYECYNTNGYFRLNVMMSIKRLLIIINNNIIINMNIISIKTSPLRTEQF